MQHLAGGIKTLKRLKKHMSAWFRLSQTEALTKEVHRSFFELRTHTETRHSELLSDVTTLGEQINALTRRLDGALNQRRQGAETSPRSSLGDLKARHAELARSYAALTHRLDQVLLHLSTVVPMPAKLPAKDSGGLKALAESVQARLEALSPKATKEQLSLLLPVLEETVLRTEEASILDLYKGDGTWLALLEQAGLPGLAAHETTGPAAQVWIDSARNTLGTQKDECLSVISARHLVASLPLEEQLWLMREAMRTLAPGGMLLIETPDPERLGIRFYDDLQHLRPLTALSLQAIAETLGFEDINTRPLATESLVFLASKPLARG